MCLCVWCLSTQNHPDHGSMCKCARCLSKAEAAHVTSLLWHPEVNSCLLYVKVQPPGTRLGLGYGKCYSGLQREKRPCGRWSKMACKEAHTARDLPLCGTWLLAAHPAHPPVPDVAPRLSSYSEDLTFRSIPHNTVPSFNTCHVF